jgi:hypothetical protein
MYSAHDTTMGAVWQFLNFTGWECLEAVFNGTYKGDQCIQDYPYFASNMILELYSQDDKSYYIQIKVNGQYMKICGEST